MRNLFKILGFVLIATSATAQQLPFTSQYMFNDYLINPAVGGSTNYTPIALSTRMQWVGLEDAPRTTFFSGHTKWGDKVGIGGYIFRDQTGPISEQGIHLSYSYHLQFDDEHKVSFGLGAMLFNYSISTANLRFDEPDDYSLSQLKQNALSPDASFGVLYYTSKYKIGFSAPQIFQNNLYDNLGTGEENTLVRHYFVHGEYNIDINDDFRVAPGGLVKMVAGAPLQYDLNVKGIYQQKYWVGASYRNQESIVALIGMQFKQFQLGYSYDITTTDLKDYSNGSHELYLALIIGPKKDNSAAKFD